MRVTRRPLRTTSSGLAGVDGWVDDWVDRRPPLGWPRPRQRWGSSRLLGPTTHHPRRTTGGVRVVGPNSKTVDLKAGAGPGKRLWFAGVIQECQLCGSVVGTSFWDLGGGRGTGFRRRDESQDRGVGRARLRSWGSRCRSMRVTRTSGRTGAGPAAVVSGSADGRVRRSGCLSAATLCGSRRSR